MTPEEHLRRCGRRQILNDQAPDGSWTLSCLHCGFGVSGYPTWVFTDRVFRNKAPRLTITVGLPGCGKTAWAEAEVANARRPTVRVSRDDYRRKFGFPAHGDRQQEEEVSGAVNRRTRALLERGTDVIRDDMFLRAGYIENYWCISRECGAEFRVKDLTGVPLEVCVARDALRPEPVGEAVIRNLWERYVRNGVALSHVL